MTIFNSYVKLPEGKGHTHYRSWETEKSPAAAPAGASQHPEEVEGRLFSFPNSSNHQSNGH